MKNIAQLTTIKNRPNFLNKGLGFFVFYVLFLFICSTAHASLSNVYIAQTSAGANTGADCADAYALSFFNNGGNWGSGASQIGPGTTVYLCGTFTAPAGNSDYMVFQGSGTSGNPITLQFETGSVIQAPYWSGPAIEMSGSWLTINGNNTGVIQATANGTNLANKQDNGIGVDAGNGCSNCEVKNLTISNLYVHTCTLPIANCTDEGGQDTYGIRAAGGNNFKVDGNTVHDVKWAIFYAYTKAGNSGFAAYNNTVYNMDHGFVFGDVSAGASGTGSIYNNDISNMGNWDDAGDDNHHDGIHSWANFSGSSYTVQDYNNYFHGVGGQGQNTWIYVELASVNSSVFNNVLTKTDNCPDGGAGLIGLADGLGTAKGTSVLNNIIIGNGTGDGCPSAIGVQNQTGATIKNNVVMNTGLFIYVPTSGQIAPGGINNNLYYNSKNGFWCPGEVEVNFAAWQSGCGFDANGVNSNPNLNTSFQLQSGSPAIGAGANLTNVGTTALDADKAGIARPASGNWDIGAYQYSSSTTVKYGDVNGDGLVNVADAEMVAQAVVGLVTLTPAQMQAAEVSSAAETKPSIYDAYLIAEYAVGLITKFPVQS